MDNENEIFDKAFYQTLEQSIGKLPQAMRAELYRPCAEGCVKRYVLEEQQRQFEECGGSLDSQYEKYGRTPYFFADIIQKGRLYEIGYPTAECLCPMVKSGMAATPVHCECSRQSMLCVLKTLLPEKDIEVNIIRTVLEGANECRFKVVVK